MDEVVFSASIRHKLKQRIIKTSVKKGKPEPDDQQLDRRVQQTLSDFRHSDSHATPEQCEQFFCSENEDVSIRTSDEKDVTRVLTKRFQPGVGKYQAESDETGAGITKVTYNPIEDGIANQTTEMTGSSFYQKPLVWPMDTIDLKVSSKGNHSCKQVLVRSLSKINDELFPYQLSVPLLQTTDLSEETLAKRDPYDPETIRLKHVLDSLSQTDQKQNEEKGKPGNENCDLLSFCSMDEALNQPRMKMLMMRSAGAPHLQHVAVPLNEREVPLSLLAISDEKDKSLLESKTGIAGRKDKAIRVRDEIQQKLLMDKQNRGQRILKLQDLVHEEETTAIEFAYNFFTAREDQRPLRPSRKERKKRMTVTGEPVNIIITVLHASNLPFRAAVNDSETADKRKQSLSVLEIETANDSVSSPVTPFVEAVFQRQAVRTSTADGSQATWNQTLDLTLKSPNGDLSPDTLSKIKDNIILNIFDEVVVVKGSGSVDENSSAQDFAQTSDGNSSPVTRTGSLVERRWLGSLSIPFSTLYLNSRIEGTFPVTTPIALMGYEFETTPASLRKSHQSHKSTFVEPNAIFLTLFLTIDPPLQKLQEADLNCGTDEDESLITYARQFDADFIKKFSDRKFASVVVSTDCKWVLVPRYLRPLRPPEVFHDTLVMEEVMRRLARYVSLIPSHAEFSSTGVVKDIWMRADQFLDLGVGDEEEHSVLLCNFFLYLGRRAGIVMGIGIPEGLTSYVITYEYSPEETRVWNACTGQRYRISDPFIPLTTVSAVITPENVYANIQDQSHPNRVDFDLDRTNCWSPLFSKKTDKLFPGLILSSPLSSIQPESLQFPAVDQDEVKALQLVLEKHLKSCLMRWRPQMATFFNRSVSQKLRKILSKLEKQTQAKSLTHKSDAQTDFKELFALYRVTGFPLQMTYTDMDCVTEAIFATGVHVTDDPKVEFALAVHVTAYPANVIALSVYVAALHLISVK